VVFFSNTLLILSTVLKTTYVRLSKTPLQLMDMALIINLVFIVITFLWYDQISYSSCFIQHDNVTGMPKLIYYITRTKYVHYEKER